MNPLSRQVYNYLVYLIKEKKEIPRYISVQTSVGSREHKYGSGMEILYSEQVVHVGEWMHRNRWFSISEVKDRLYDWEPCPED